MEAGPTRLLIFLLALAIVGLVSYFFVTSIRMATNTPILQVQGAPTIVGSKLYISLRNLGTASADLSSSTVVLDCASGTFSLPAVILEPGESQSLEIDIGTPPSAAFCSGILSTPYGTIPLSVDVLG